MRVYNYDGMKIQSDYDRIVYLSSKHAGDGIKITLTFGGGRSYFVPNLSAKDIRLDTMLFRFTDIDNETHVINMKYLEDITEVSFTKITANYLEHGKEAYMFKSTNKTQDIMYASKKGVKPKVILGNAYGKFYTTEWSKGYEKPQQQTQSNNTIY